VLENLRVPVVLGRGTGRSAAVGASIALEVKCGQAAYLQREKEHLRTQTQGHRGADASLTICSRDVKDLGHQEEEELRAALRGAGSALVGMLPRKEEIDRACWQVVTASPAGQSSNGTYEESPE
jgi:hypothetical protein